MKIQILLSLFHQFALLCTWVDGQSTPANVNQSQSITTDATTHLMVYPDDSKSGNGNEMACRNQVLVDCSYQLDSIFNETIVILHWFITSQNTTIGNFALNLSTIYINKLTDDIDSVQEVNNSNVLEINNLTVLNINGSKQKDFDVTKCIQTLEVAKLLNFVLNETLNSYEETSQFDLTSANVSNSSSVLMEFIVLHSIINRSSKIRKLNDLALAHEDNYNRTKHISDLEDIIHLLHKVIPLYSQILQEIKDMKLFQSDYEVDGILISNDTACLLNESYWKTELDERVNFLNETRKNYDDILLTKLLDQVLLPCLNGIVFVVGMAGNVLLLVIFATQSQLRSPPNLMVINLTISDVINLVVNALLDTVDHILSPWTLGTFLCQVFWFFKYLSMGLSVYSIVVISLQRFFALTNTCECGSFMFLSTGFCKSILLIFGVWIFASIISSPRGYFAHVHVKLGICNCCKMSSNSFTQLVVAEFLVYCLLPLALICITSCIMSRRLAESVRNMPGEALGKNKATKSRVLSSKILFALTVVFAVSYIPTMLYVVIDTSFDLGLTNIQFLTIDYVVYALTFFSPCFNPIALFLASRKYRRVMCSYLMCKKRASVYSNDASATSTTTVETKL